MGSVACFQQRLERCFVRQAEMVYPFKCISQDHARGWIVCEQLF